MDEMLREVSAEGFGLLERAVSYTRGSLQLVTPDRLSSATPCSEWDLRALLEHMDDALLAMHEAAHSGRIQLEPPPVVGELAVDLVAAVCSHACQLLGALAGGGGDVVYVDRLPLSTGIVAGAGAVDVAVHGWDVAQACGRHRPVPPGLAAELYDLVPLFVTEEERAGRFGPVVQLPALASSGDRLVAFLGRNPHQALANRAASWLCRTS